MLSQGLRFLLLRFLPRRVLPILTAIEIYASSSDCAGVARSPSRRAGS